MHTVQSNANNLWTDLFDAWIGTLRGTNTLTQSGAGSNGDEGVTPHTPDLQNWNATTRCSSVLYLCPPIRGGLIPL